ncbi:MAG TPA: thiamine-phosphate kinase [Streptosporangiaceae bacterium]|nr:thiamine-phosphate kinase [Streptosporangiaceae bacterium]
MGGWRATDGEGVITIGELGEFGLIAAITQRMAAAAGGSGSADEGRVILGAGDDAAVIEAPDRRVVATADMLLEGRHFRRDWSSAADVGHKAAARNLADVAAMGAVPTALLVCFAGPPTLAVDWVLELAEGIAAECAGVGAQVAGGDTSNADTVLLAITAFGDLVRRAPVTRSGARPGDVVAIAGTLGSAAAGLDLLRANTETDADGALAGLVRAHRRPSPPYAAGWQAAQLGATSMIDVSDGLIGDLGHVAQASGVRCELDSARLGAEPIARVSALRQAAAQLSGNAGGPQWLRWVLTGGDDHALAATFPPDVALPSTWTVVGTVEKGHGIAVDGQNWSDAGGWEHFRTLLPSVNDRFLSVMLRPGKGLI